MTELEGWKMFPQASRKMSRSPRWICQCGTLRRKMAREIDRNPFGTGKIRIGGNSCKIRDVAIIRCDLNNSRPIFAEILNKLED